MPNISRNYTLKVNLFDPEGHTLRIRKIILHTPEGDCAIEPKHVALTHMPAEDTDGMVTCNSLIGPSIRCRYDHDPVAVLTSYLKAIYGSPDCHVAADVAVVSSFLPRPDTAITSIQLTHKEQNGEAVLFTPVFPQKMPIQPITPALSIQPWHNDAVRDLMAKLIQEAFTSYKSSTSADGHVIPLSRYVADYCVDHGIWADLNYKQGTEKTYPEWYRDHT